MNRSGTIRIDISAGWRVYLARSCLDLNGAGWIKQVGVPERKAQEVDTDRQAVRRGAGRRSHADGQVNRRELEGRRQRTVTVRLPGLADVVSSLVSVR